MLENMKEIYNYTEPYDNVVLTGLVGLYEICFEQSWKIQMFCDLRKEVETTWL